MECHAMIVIEDDHDGEGKQEGKQAGENALREAPD